MGQRFRGDASTAASIWRSTASGGAAFAAACFITVIAGAPIAGTFAPYYGMIPLLLDVLLAVVIGFVWRWRAIRKRGAMPDAAVAVRLPEDLYMYPSDLLDDDDATYVVRHIMWIPGHDYRFRLFSQNLGIVDFQIDDDWLTVVEFRSRSQKDLPAKSTDLDKLVEQLCGSSASYDFGNRILTFGITPMNG